MGTKYSSQATSGYNSSPPPDDGTQVAANLITWAGVKTKLADVLKTFAEAINTALVSALDLSARAISVNDTAIASDHWKTLQVTGATTIQLSSAASMGGGYEVGVFNAGAGVVTVAPAGSDTINAVSASVTVPIKGTIIFRTNQALTGYNVVGQSNRMDAGTINGAAIDNSAIGATTPSTGVFSTLKVGTGQIGLGTIPRRKTADESVNNAGTGTTLHNDTLLNFAIAANEEWTANFQLNCGDSLNVTGIKVAVTAPAGSALSVSANNFHNAYGTTTVSGTAIDFIAASANSLEGIQVNFWVLNGATPGNINLQWAQSTASATNLTVKKGSFMNAVRIA